MVGFGAGLVVLGAVGATVGLLVCALVGLLVEVLLGVAVGCGRAVPTGFAMFSLGSVPGWSMVC